MNTYLTHVHACKVALHDYPLNFCMITQDYAWLPAPVTEITSSTLWLVKITMLTSSSVWVLVCYIAPQPHSALSTPILLSCLRLGFLLVYSNSIWTGHCALCIVFAVFCSFNVTYHSSEFMICLLGHIFSDVFQNVHMAFC